MTVPKLMSSLMRLVTIALLMCVAVGCHDATAPTTTYTLVTVNGAALPAPMWPGSGIFVRSASLTLYPDGRALSRVLDMCDPAPPVDALCDAGRESVVAGTYSRQAGVVTYGADSYPATFESNGVVIRFSTGSYSTGSPAVWQYKR